MTEQVTLIGSKSMHDSRNNRVTNDGRVISSTGQTLCTLDQARFTAIAQRDLEPHRFSGFLSAVGAIFSGQDTIFTADAPDGFIPNLCRSEAARPAPRR